MDTETQKKGVLKGVDLVSKIDHRRRKMVGTRSERSFRTKNDFRKIKIGGKSRILNS